MKKNKLLGIGFLVLAFAFVVASVPSKVFGSSTPTIGSIAPAYGIVTGGTTITITGTNFATGATVTVGGNPATGVNVASATSITAITPAGTAGAQSVIVTNPDNGTVTGTFTYVAAPTAISLGLASTYAILAETAVTTTGVTSIVGNVGLSPAAASYLAGFGQTMDSGGTFSTSSLVAGKIYAANYTSPANLGTAVTNMGTAYDNASNSTTTPTTVLDAGAGSLGGLNLSPGVYTFDGAGNVNIATNLTLTGSSSGVWIFQIPGNLNISSATSVILNGAVPANVFWVVAGTTTLGTTSTFEGNILDKTNIAMNNGATLNGKALAQTAVTLIGDNIVDPVIGSAAAAGTASAAAGISTITYTLSTGTFDGAAGIVNGNWTLGGANVADLGSISSVVLSSGNKVATITINGTAGVVFGHTYTVAPTQATFMAGFTAPSAATVTVAPVNGSGALTNGTTTTTTPAPLNVVPLSTPPVTITITPVVTVVPTAATISGCVSNMGFSTVTGQSCSGNTIVVVTTAPVVIAGCNNGTTGFSTVNGQSCVTNGTSTTTTTSYNFGTVTLKSGSKGAAVKELQRFLNNKLNLKLVLDGNLGPKTIAIIKQWQKANGLVADGLVGAKTKALMQTEAESN